MDKLIPSFKKTIFESNKDSIIELSEIGIDSVVDSEIIVNSAILLTTSQHGFIYFNFMNICKHFYKSRCRL